MLKNYYKTLGVAQSASSEEIKKAYRALAFQYHPDRNDTEHARKLFAEINEAYHNLSDPLLKSEYDYKIFMEGDFEEPTEVEASNTGQRHYNEEFFNRNLERYYSQTKQLIKVWAKKKVNRRELRIFAAVAKFSCITGILLSCLLFADNQFLLSYRNEIVTDRSDESQNTSGILKTGRGEFKVAKNWLYRIKLGDTIAMKITPVTQIIKEIKHHEQGQEVLYQPILSHYNLMPVLCGFLLILSIAGYSAKEVPKYLIPLGASSLTLLLMMLLIIIGI
jgi:hypothetical protein